MFSSKRPGRGAITVTSALVATALVAGTTSTTAFADTGSVGSGQATGRAGAGLRWVTLITGDRVGMDARDRVVSVERGEGREKVSVRSWTERGSTYAVPADAERLITAGKLDRRLFDVTALSSPGSRRAYRDGLKVIVEYEGASAAGARTGVRTDAELARTLPSINADAVTVPKQDAGGLWAVLTGAGAGAGAGGGSARAGGSAPGIERVWLDAVYTANLDTSVGRIGAPKAWRSGYDGKGVTIAVLDSGVDDTHPDLATQVIGAANFTSSPDTKDRHGHGTHIASIAAGTGAKSGGTYQGVAPGAKILNGKIMNDIGATESGTIAAVDWAVGRGADIVSMSFGSGDTPEVTPLEAHINRVSKEKGVLFTVSASNEGPTPGSVGSPGSAEAALTVGAVDDADRIAPFSSVGPLHDGAIKPDITAPGVGITAASAPGSHIAGQVGENPAGYFSIGGTSMAAPHVAGAAALLKQRHPGWSGERLKAALTGSAQDGGYSVFQQGAGRLAADRAVEQTVTADESSLSFGRQQWPHTDDQPVAKHLTYRNHGTQEITLDLAVKGLDLRGGPTPAGFFTLGTHRVTLPAGGTVTVPFTADTRIGGDVNGIYTAVVTATGGGQSVRTTASVDREVESYDLSLDFVGRDGTPNANFFTRMRQLSGAGDVSVTLREGSTAKLRLPRGDYALQASLYQETGGMDQLVHPRLALTKDTALTIDARVAKPVVMTVPDPQARMTAAWATHSISIGERSLEDINSFTTFDDFRTAQLGPDQPTGVKLRSALYAQRERDAATQYGLAAGGEVKRLFTGYTKRFEADDFAKVTATLGASVQGKNGHTTALGGKDRFDFNSAYSFALPGSRTHHLATDGKVNLWSLSASQHLDVHGSEEIEYTAPEREFRPGTSHRMTLGSAVHSPLMHEQSGVFREGNRLTAFVPLFSDGRGNVGQSWYSSAKTTLHQGTTKIGEVGNTPETWKSYAVGADDAEYTLSTSATRDRTVSAVGTRINGSWTFRSAKPPTDGETRTGLSTVRFGAQVDLDGTVAADRTVTYPVTVQGPAAGAGLKSLAVSVSYDGGTTWQQTPVAKGKITVKNPAQGQTVALRGEVADTRGGKASVTVYDAYRGK
ncbi:S8 family serine peptidase [Streptomyces sp. NPDC059816]|uniref:S8 family serine peptidase n=1 Tax=Streptomyces sp. NPDC059816 TaxID=3346960 RepID=UPI00365E8B04